MTLGTDLLSTFDYLIKLKKLEVIFVNILHLKTKQNKSSTAWCYYNQDFDENFFLFLVFMCAFMKQSHQKLYKNVSFAFLKYVTLIHYEVNNLFLNCLVFLILRGYNEHLY